jgi:SAM-dependent methyltransferase
MLNLIRKLVPRPIKRAIRRQRDARDRKRLFGALAPLVPGVEQMFDGPSTFEEFKANGEEFLDIYRTICGLRPDERMLDVGSGIGRKTIQLTRYFDERAAYDGIDVTAAGVEWCARTITPRFPNFRFRQIDVFNKLYNPSGTRQPAEYRFPFADASFTFVMLGSVFTHMLPDDAAHYLAEIARVLKPGGRCLISYFLFNDEARALVEQGRSTLDFHVVRDRYATVDPDVPENAIALDETFIMALYSQLGLSVRRMERGSWCGREQFLSYQDLILAVKG